MVLGRRNRPSIVQTAARAAVISGSATAASNAVNSRAARRQAAAAPAAPAAPAAANEDVIAKLERLAALHASGALTDAEFATLKAQALG